MPSTQQGGREPPRIEHEGRRCYVAGDTYPIKDRLAAVGCTWDRERRQWWIGAAKVAAVEAVLAEAAAAPPPPPPADIAAARVRSKWQYKGRSYYAIAVAQGGGRLRLVSLDGTIDFWADAARCTLVKEYPPREYRGRVEYTTIGSLRAFLARQGEPATRRGRCTECDAWGPSGETCAQCCEGTHL